MDVRVNEAASWGCKIENLRIERRPEHGGTPFVLDVRDFFLSCGRGQQNRIPIMGPSGAGKSTLLNILSGVEWPTPCQARVVWTFPGRQTPIQWSMGRGPEQSDLRRLRRNHFAYAFQSSNLLPYLSVVENLTMALRNFGLGIKEAREKVLPDVLASFDQDEERVARILESYPHQLSGGERQRASLLMALSKDPDVLFADEPTGSLDSETRVQVMQTLLRWVDRKPDDRLLIWVTHHQNDPRDNFADKRLWVENGLLEWQVTKALAQ